MTLPVKRYALACCVLLAVTASAAPVSAQPSCDRWNTWKFFDNADAATVYRCLKTQKADARDEQGYTPLHWAAGFIEDPTVITTLVQAGADIHARNDQGQTPLNYGAGHNNKNPAVLTALVQAGADIHTRDTLGRTTLDHASQFIENPAVITALVQAGADIHARDLGRSTPLHHALMIRPKPAIITVLVAAGADPDARNDSGDTPLQLAKEINDPALIAAFSDEAVAAFRAKENQARAEAQKREMEERLKATLVSCDKWNTAAFFRQATTEDVLRCLHTESPNAKDEQGRTPMHLAALDGKPEIIAALAEAGANPDGLDGKGRTPLHLVAVLGTAPEAVTALVKAGANLDAPDKKGRTPLEFAEIFSETPAIVAALRDAKTQASAPPKAAATESCEDWNTPRFFRNASPEDLSRCLETQDPNARNDNGRTPMHYAAQGTSPALVTALAKAGANLDAPDEKGGWTPLHLAAWFSTSPSVVAALLAAGADPTVTDKEGKTPWDYARENTALEGTPPYWRLNEERSQ